MPTAALTTLLTQSSNAPFWGKDTIVVATTALCVTIGLFTLRFMLGKARNSPTKNFRNQGLLLLLTVAGVLIVILSLPDGDNRREQMLTLFGVVMSAAIALSSTTFLGNALAGVQLRVVGAFKAGDFLRVDEHFGRITERGLFHTEIQNEDRDLTTLPNLYLVSNAYKVVRASGSIISCTVSLGYDVPRAEIEASLIEAATKLGLVDPFVQVLELGDFSVSYRVAGLLTEVKHILTSRSSLRKRVIDALHGAGIEIVSPTFMNTRGLQLRDRVVPEPSFASSVDPIDTTKPPETLMFDKAERAESVEKVTQNLTDAEADLLDAEKRLKAATEEEKPALEREVESRVARRETLQHNLEMLQQRLGEDGESRS